MPTANRRCPLPRSLRGFPFFRIAVLLLGVSIATTPAAAGDPASICGDGVVGIGEQCDDGNTTAADFCDSKCASLCGDVDCSGAAQAPDALRVLRFAVGQPVVVTCAPECGVHENETTPREIPATGCADVNCDTKVSAADALAVLKRAVGQDVAVTCGYACYGSTCGDGQLCDEGWNCVSGPGGRPEQCDDGNSVEDDGCSTGCAVPVSACDDFQDDPSPAPPPREVEADAGGDREVLRGSLVELSAEVTAPPAAEVELCWILDPRPEDSEAALDDPGAANTFFYADEPGDYHLTLRAAAGDVVSHPSRAVVSARTVRADVPAETGERLVSADHALVMEVLPGAVEEETELSIELRRPEDLPEELADAEPAATYEFGPDGASFNSPIALRWEGEPDPDDAPVVVVAVDGEETADADAALSHLSSEGTAVEWETDHFSGAALLKLRAVALVVDGPLVAGVGHRFEISYSAKAPFGPAGLSVATQREGAFAVAPQVLAPLPKTTVVDDLRYDSDLSLVLPGNTSASGLVSGLCVAPGTVRVGFEVKLSAAVIRAILPSGNFSRSPVVQLSAEVRCVGAGTAPVAVDDPVSIPFVASSAIVNPLGNDFDPDGRLDPASIEIVRKPFMGDAVANPDGTITVTLGGGLRLVDTVRYRVSDQDGFESNTATISLRRFDLPNNTPTLLDDAFTVAVGVAEDLAVLANDVDADGTLDPATVAVTQLPAEGDVQVNADGSVRYTPDPGFTGSDSFRYQAADNRGAVGASALVNVEVVSTTPAPVAVDDDDDTFEDESVDVDALANDTGLLAPSSLEVTIDPIFGSVEIVQSAGGDPVFRYTPPAASTGVGSFHYRVANPDGVFSNEALVRVFVTDPDNEPPVAVDDEASTPQATPVDIPIGVNDSDPDGLLTLGTEFIVTAPANGEAEPFGAGTFRYTPDPDFLGMDTFTYRIADNDNAVSNEATVTIEVFEIPNQAPVAEDDDFVVGPNAAALLPVLANDSDADGTLDPTSVVVTVAPSHGSAVPGADGRVSYTPTAAFVGDDTFSYRVADDDGDLSNVATVTIGVRDFAGVDGNPVDNISAAQVHFFAHYGSNFVDQGIGGFFGFNHADAAALANLTPISDYTWWFEGNPDSGEAGATAGFSMQTDLQSGVATYDAMSKIHAITGFTPGALFPDSGGTLTIEPVGGGTVSSVDAPPTLLDGGGDPTVFRGPFNRFRTEVQFADGEFTHLLLRAIELTPTSVRGVLMRVPAEEMELDMVTGMRHRPILDELAASTVDSLGFEPTLGIAVVFYNQEDNSAYFTGPGQRTVPLAAGRGVSLPAAQMAAPRVPCADRPTGVECMAGTREVLMAVNQTGTVTMHSPEDGSFLDTFLGKNAPNFVIESGWHLVQDPATNCLLFSDSDDRKVSKYDTDGDLITDAYITTAGGAGAMFTPRGLAFRDGELLVTDTVLGRILRFSGAGAFLGELATGVGTPNGLFVAASGDVMFSDESSSNPNDTVRLVPADGGAVRSVIGGGLSTPYQISALLDGNLAVASFGQNQIRVFGDGFPTIANVTVGTNPSSSGNMNPRGIWPLRNGNFLTTLSNGGGVAVLDPEMVPTAYVSTTALGSTFRFLSSVCLPE